MTDQEILIIKDPESENFYALFQRDYDDENEYTVICKGNSELECSKNASQILLNKINILHNKLKSLNSIFFDSEVYLNDEIVIESFYIKRPVTWEGGRITESFDAFIKNEDGTFGCFYR